MMICTCATAEICPLPKSKPIPLQLTDINHIRLNLFTERNSDGSGYLQLIGTDIYDRYKRRIEDSDIRAISEYLLKTPRRITRLDLPYNNITDVGFFKLLKRCLIKGRSSLINLNIMNNQLTELSMFQLWKYAKHIKLRYLRISGNKFGTKGGEYFARFLCQNKSLEYSDISESDQTLTSVACIIAALRHDHGGNETLKVFEFNRLVPLFNRYQYETKWLAYHIEHLFEHNHTLIEIHLQKNEFCGHDAEYFIRGLRRNSTVLYLDLGFNKVGDYGAELFAKYLAEGSQLIFLNLAGNGIGNTGARALSFGLPSSKIRALDISHNKLTDRGVLDILNSLKKPYFIRFLNIWGNKFGFVTCQVLERMLLSGTLFQHTIDVRLYEVDGILYAAYHPNPADRNKHLYYCELEYAVAQPILHITRNVITEPRRYKMDCKQRHRLDKTNRSNY